MAPGDCFRFINSPTLDDHRWIVLSPPTNGRIAIANITSLGSELEDRTCVLEACDHDSLSHQSCIVYEKARLIEASVLTAHERVNKIRWLKPLRPEVLKRVIAGAYLRPPGLG